MDKSGEDMSVDLAFLVLGGGGGGGGGGVSEHVYVCM